MFGSVAAETARVDVVITLLFDAPQPIENFLLDENENKIKNSKRERNEKKRFFSLFFILLFAEQDVC